MKISTRIGTITCRWKTGGSCVLFRVRGLNEGRARRKSLADSQYGRNTVSEFLKSESIITLLANARPHFWCTSLLRVLLGPYSGAISCTEDSYHTPSPTVTQQDECLWGSWASFASFRSSQQHNEETSLISMSPLNELGTCRNQLLAWHPLKETRRLIS